MNLNDVYANGCKSGKRVHQSVWCHFRIFHACSAIAVRCQCKFAIHYILVIIYAIFVSVCCFCCCWWRWWWWLCSLLCIRLSWIEFCLFVLYSIFRIYQLHRVWRELQWENKNKTMQKKRELHWKGQIIWFLLWLFVLLAQIIVFVLFGIWCEGDLRAQTNRSLDSIAMHSVIDNNKPNWMKKEKSSINWYDVPHSFYEYWFECSLDSFWNHRTWPDCQHCNGNINHVLNAHHSKTN